MAIYSYLQHVWWRVKGWCLKEADGYRLPKEKRRKLCTPLKIPQVQECISGWFWIRNTMAFLLGYGRSYFPYVVIKKEYLPMPLTGYMGGISPIQQRRQTFPEPLGLRSYMYVWPGLWLVRTSYDCDIWVLQPGLGLLSFIPQMMLAPIQARIWGDHSLHTHWLVQ